MNWKYIIPFFAIAVACETPSSKDEAKIFDKPTNLIAAINPIEGTNEAPRMFQVNADQAKSIDLGNGGSLEFPANAFVDENGKPVKGKVDIEWQEFHSLGDIMLSGIPMKYDSAGVNYDFESGGMFTIHASQKGNPVEIAPSKKVGVNVASIQDTPCYNFYEIDEESGDWTYETTKLGEPESTQSETTNVQDEVKQVDLLDVTLSTKSFPELAKLDIVGWEVKRTLKPAEKRILKLQSTKLRLIQTDSLGLTLEAKTATNQSLKYPVAPYTVDRALAASKVNRQEMEKSFAETREYAKEMLAGRVIRSIDIDNFGTYNWDVIFKRQNSKPLFAKFNFPKNVNPQLVSLFLVSPDENIIVNYNPAGDDKFSFDPDKKNCLIAILPGNKIVSVSNEGFSFARSLKKGQVCEFEFKETGIKLTSSKDIMNHMNALI